jgi:hypothetical protein
MAAKPLRGDEGEAVASTDLPDRQFVEMRVQPSLQKYSASPFGRNSSSDSAIPSIERGVGHRHERRGGMRWTRQRLARKPIAGRVLD